MSTTTCPACQQSVDLAELPRGREAACPACGAALRGSGQSDIAEGPPKAIRFADETGERAPTGRRRHADDFDDIEVDAAPEKWRRTIVGIRLAWWSSLGFLVAVVAQNAVQVAVPMLPDEQNLLHPSFVAALLSGVVIMIGTVVYFVGIAICCTAPDAWARRLALISIFSWVATVLLAMVFGGIVGYLAAAQGQQVAAGRNIDWFALLSSAGGAPLVLGGLLVVVVLIGYGAWFLFYAAVANAFGDRPLRRFALLNLFLWPPATALLLGIGFCPVSAVGLDERAMARLQAGLGIILNVITYGLYLLLCSRTIATIQTGLNREFAESESDG